MSLRLPLVGLAANDPHVDLGIELIELLSQFFDQCVFAHMFIKNVGWYGFLSNLPSPRLIFIV